MQNHDTKMLQRDRIVLCDNHGILGQDYCPGYDQLTNFKLQYFDFWPKVIDTPLLRFWESFQADMNKKVSS